MTHSYCLAYYCSLAGLNPLSAWGSLEEPSKAIKPLRVSACVISCFTWDSLKLQEVQIMNQWLVIYACLWSTAIGFELIEFTIKPSWLFGVKCSKETVFVRKLKVNGFKTTALHCLPSNGHILEFNFWVNCAFKVDMKGICERRFSLLWQMLYEWNGLLRKNVGRDQILSIGKWLDH